MKQKYFRLLVFTLILLATGFQNNVLGQVLITTDPVETALVGMPYVYDINVVKSGADSSFSLVKSLSDMEIDPSTGVITWTPSDVGQGGQVEVEVTVGTLTETQSFYIYVSDAVVCDDDMISYWKLDEATGNTFTDFKGGYDAITGVAPTVTDGIVGNGQLFDPAEDIRLTVANDGDQYGWLAGESMSVALWFKSAVDISGVSQVFIGRLGTGSGGTSNKHWWWFGLDNNNYVHAEVTNEAGEGAEQANVLRSHSAHGKHYDDDKWHFAVFTLEGNSSNQYTLRIYVDGVFDQANNAPVTKTFAAGNFTNSTSDLNIGWWQSPWSVKYEFEGSLDEPAIYSRVLTAEEILQMYNDGLNSVPYCLPGNYAPLFKSAPVTEVDEGAQYIYNIEADDIDDSDILTITTVSGPVWLSSFTDNGNGTATLSGTPANSDVGEHLVTIRVSDSKIDIDQTFTIRVDNVNDKPVFTSTPVTTVDEDTEYTYNITTEDVDAGSSVSISAQSVLPSWLTLTDNGDGTADLTGIPLNEHVGTVNVTLRVTDNVMEYNDQSFIITVVNVNDPPVITGQSPLSINEDENIVILLTDLIVTDVDNNYPDDFELEVLAGEHYTFNGTTVIPEENWFGTLIVNIAVSDLSSTVNGTVTIEVVPVNDLPEFTSDPVTEATAGTIYQYWVSAADAEDTELTFEAVTLPSWASFTYNTTLSMGVLQGTPANTDASTANVSLRVTDSEGGIAVQDFVITVSGTVAVAVNDINAGGFIVYPTIVRNKLYVKNDNDEAGKFQILTLSGTVVKETAISGRNTTDIDVSDLKSGLYLYRLISGKKQINGKFTRE